MKVLKSMFVSSLVASMLVSTASLLADVIPVDEAFWKGSRSTDRGEGITATQSWSGSRNDGFQLGWSISQSSGLYHYVYTVTDTSGEKLDKKLSDFILQVGDAFTSKDYLDSKGAPISGIVVTNYDSSVSGGSNPLMPGVLYGVDTSTNSYTLKIDFYSSRAPVWGSFYANGGTISDKAVVAYNNGFTSESSTPTTGTKDFTNYIARPGGDELAVPEPATILIMGSSLAALYAARRRKSNESQ